MKGVAFRYVNDAALSEDIIQEAFIKVFVNIQTFDTSGSFGGWLHRVVVNAAIDHFNKIKKQNHKVVADLSTISENGHHEEVDNNYDYSMEELVESISKLPEGYKLVFNMYVVDDFSHKEIAAALNITEGASKSQLSKARGYLRNYLEKNKTVNHAR